MLIENASDIFKKMVRAAIRAGKSPRDIKLIAVTKTVDIETIKEAIDNGLRIFGESRIQEAKSKIAELRSQSSDLKLEWHLIGYLQKNKAKYAVRMFDLIHTIDSEDLAEKVNIQAEKIEKIQRILIQVKLSEGEAGHGLPEKKLLSLLGKIQKLNNLKLEGLMTMPPFFDDPEKTRPYFKRLREIRDESEKKGFSLSELSMGMSNDFEVAAEEGATMVRVGTALFGEREK